jgi:hypothetical protein
MEKWARASWIIPIIHHISRKILGDSVIGLTSIR